MRSFSLILLSITLSATALAQDEPGGPKTGTDEVVRAQSGDYGMFFRFGGLASLFAGGNTRAVTDDLLLTQFGLKIVLSEEVMIPIVAGAGFRRFKADAASDGVNDWGLDVGSGVEYHFRIWRRISPYVGVLLSLGFTDFDGDDNSLIAFGIGPQAGVEYYIFDRVSLQAHYTLTFNILRAFDNATITSIQTLAGGAMNLTYYF